MPRVFSEVHTVFKTPYKTNLIFLVVVGAFAAFVPGDIVGDMTSIGTLFAFMLVCAAVIILRKSDPDMHREFKTPFVPFVPILGILVCVAMILGPTETKNHGTAIKNAQYRNKRDKRSFKFPVHIRI